jgi:predicted transcriptional regulator
MVAPNYAEQRRSLAKKIGLGTKRKRGPGRKPAAGK